MEYEATFTSLQEQCNCCICLERFVDPATLPCTHTCCRICLEKILKIRKNDNEQNMIHAYIMCPICRTSHSFQGKSTLQALKVSKDIKDRLTILKAMTPEDTRPRPVETCQICTTLTKKGADYKCLVCDINFCSQCIEKKHDNEPGKDVHNVVCLHRNDTGGNDLHCREHNFLFRYFCKTCDQLSCSECYITDHRSHDVIYARDARQHVQRQVQSTIDSAKAKIKNNNTTGVASKIREKIREIEMSNKETLLREMLRNEKLKIFSQVIFILEQAEDQILKSYQKEVFGMKRHLEAQQDNMHLGHYKAASWDHAYRDLLKIKDHVDFIAKAEHVKNQVGAFGIEKFFQDSATSSSFELIDAGLPDSVITDLMQSLGKLRTRFLKIGRTHSCILDEDVADKAKKLTSHSLSQQLKNLKIDGLTSTSTFSEPLANPSSNKGNVLSSNASRADPFQTGTNTPQTNSNAAHYVHNVSGNVGQQVFQNVQQPPFRQLSSFTSSAAASVFPGMNVQINHQSMPDVRAQTGQANHPNESNDRDGQMQRRGRGRGRCRGRGRGGQRGGNHAMGFSNVDDSDWETTSQSTQSDSSGVVVYCFRCYRHGHTFRSCHAVKDTNGTWIKGVFQNRCYRCGRKNHISTDCYARYDEDGDFLG